MKIELELKEAGQLPERDGKVVVIVENEPCEKYSVFSTTVKKGRNVKFLNNKVVWWAYFPDDEEVESLMNATNFDKDWIEFLNKNAIK